MKKKSIAILSALAMAGAAAAAGVAGTVAYFNSHSEIDVTVNAAKVDVQASAPTIVSKSLQYKADGAAVVVGNDGTVSGTLLVPGDTFIIKVSYTNKSTIGIYYKIAAKAVKVTVTDDFKNGGTGKVTIGVDAVQNNAPIEDYKRGYKRDDHNKVVNVYSLEGLLKVQDYLSTKSDSEVNALNGYTLTLENDIDLSSIANWQGLITNKNRAFNLNFNGKGHTIKKLTITNGTGFIDHFGATSISSDVETNSKGERYQAHGNYVFKNVVFDNAHVVNLDVNTGNLGAGNCAGVVAGMTHGLDLEGVTVKNSYVEAYKWVGGLAGYLMGVEEKVAHPSYYYQFQHVIKDCHVESTIIKARHYRAGGSVARHDRRHHGPRQHARAAVAPARSGAAACARRGLVCL